MAQNISGSGKIHLETSGTTKLCGTRRGPSFFACWMTGRCYLIPSRQTWSHMLWRNDSIAVSRWQVIPGDSIITINRMFSKPHNRRSKNGWASQKIRGSKHEGAKRIALSQTRMLCATRTGNAVSFAMREPFLNCVWCGGSDDAAAPSILNSIFSCYP